MAETKSPPLIIFTCGKLVIFEENFLLQFFFL